MCFCCRLSEEQIEQHANQFKALCAVVGMVIIEKIGVSKCDTLSIGRLMSQYLPKRRTPDRLFKRIYDDESKQGQPRPGC